MQPRNLNPRSEGPHSSLAHPTPTTVSLNSGDGPGSVVINAFAFPIDLNAFGAQGEPPKPVALEVVPPPGANGVLPARDGRRQRVTDAAKLAGALNAQSFVARVDFDHRSEPSAPTFAGTTEAEGWLSNYRLNHRGGIDADVELGANALERVRAKKYRYVSPALHLDRSGNVVALSSLALVNNPNLPLSAPSIHSESDMSGDTDPQALQAKIDDLQRQLDASQTATRTILENSAAQAVDQAVTAGGILPAERDYHLNSIKAHPDGIEKGVEAFNGLMEARGGTGATKTPAADLTRRTGPAGAPPSGGGPGGGPAFLVPNGWTPPSDERLELHSQIAEYAQKRGIPYRQAMTEFGATYGV